MNATLEVVILPVSDPDKSLDFYRDKLRFALDVDYFPTKDFRVVQLTPPGSSTSIQFGIGLTDAPPGSVQGLYLVVTDVAANGPAAEKDLRPGDVIAEVDQKAVTSAEDVGLRVKSAQDNGYRVVTLLVNRGGDFQWIALKIGK